MAVLYAGYYLSVSGLRPRFSTAAVMAYDAPAACAALLPVARLSGESLSPASWQGWAVLAGMAVSSRTCSGGAWSPTPSPGALAGLPAAFSSVALLLQPTIAAALAWAILGEALGTWQVAGLALPEGGRPPAAPPRWGAPHDGKRPVPLLYSPECVEGSFSELRAEGVLRSSPGPR